jgi:3-hydroxy-D-aspartate aldolase
VLQAKSEDINIGIPRSSSGEELVENKKKELEMSQSLGPADLNRTLIGVKGGVARIATPALVLDLDLFECNLDQMTIHCAAKGLALRPHAKTHKSADIANIQIKAGALGICAAKLAEAEALARGGVQNIHITSGIVTDQGIERVMRLNAAISDLMITVEDLGIAKKLDSAAKSAGKPLNVIIDIDIGLHRTGIAWGPKALALTLWVSSSDDLIYRGIQGYAGHVMHIEDFDERVAASTKSLGFLKDAKDALTGKGLAPEIVTGGGTGTYNIDCDLDILTELQAGSYIFMDAQYNDVPLSNGQKMPFETSLTVQNTVISANTPGLVTTDAGFKSFAADADAPVIMFGAPEGASYFFFGDEQGGVMLESKEESLPLGSLINCITPHCDPTVNLYDVYHCVRGDTLVDIWEVTARGCSQ